MYHILSILIVLQSNIVLASSYGMHNHDHDKNIHMSTNKPSIEMNSQKYNNFIELNRIKELQRQKKIEKTDLNILKKYKKFNNIMLENK